MAKINNIKRIIKEDFPEDQQELIDKLSYSLNPFMEQVSNAFNKGINNDNLSREFIQVTVENTAGELKIPTQFKTNLKGRIQGFHILNVENLTNTTTYPTAAPWISWTISGNIITIKKVTGIQDDNKYRFTLEIVT